jgi:G3E family GTPase
MQLNPGVKIIDSDYAKVDLDEIVDTHYFNYDRTSGSAAWVRELERLSTDEENEAAKYPEHDHHHHDEEEDHLHHHEHDHHHHDEEDHHHHEGGEVEEYGIGTFVYYRRQAFDLDKFDRFVNLNWPKNVIRAKGICYFSFHPDMSYLFEQAGVQVKVTEAGQWYATMPEDELLEMIQRDAGLAHDWDEEYGDRMQKIVFIGQHMDKDYIVSQLDACLV